MGASGLVVPDTMDDALLVSADRVGAPPCPRRWTWCAVLTLVVVLLLPWEQLPHHLSLLPEASGSFTRLVEDSSNFSSEGSRRFSEEASSKDEVAKLEREVQSLKAEVQSLKAWKELVEHQVTEGGLELPSSEKSDKGNNSGAPLRPFCFKNVSLSAQQLGEEAERVRRRMKDTKTVAQNFILQVRLRYVQLRVFFLEAKPVLGNLALTVALGIIGFALLLLLYFVHPQGDEIKLLMQWELKPAKVDAKVEAVFSLIVPWLTYLSCLMIGYIFGAAAAQSIWILPAHYLPLLIRSTYLEKLLADERSLENRMHSKSSRVLTAQGHEEMRSSACSIANDDPCYVEVEEIEEGAESPPLALPSRFNAKERQTVNMRARTRALLEAAQEEAESAHLRWLDQAPRLTVVPEGAEAPKESQADSRASTQDPSDEAQTQPWASRGRSWASRGQRSSSSSLQDPAADWGPEEMAAMRSWAQRDSHSRHHGGRLTYWSRRSADYDLQLEPADLEGFTVFSWDFVLSKLEILDMVSDGAASATAIFLPDAAKGRFVASFAGGSAVLRNFMWAVGLSGAMSLGLLYATLVQCGLLPLSTAVNLEQAGLGLEAGRLTQRISVRLLLVRILGENLLQLMLQGSQLMAVGDSLISQPLLLVSLCLSVLFTAKKAVEVTVESTQVASRQLEVAAFAAVSWLWLFFASFRVVVLQLCPCHSWGVTTGCLALL